MARISSIAYLASVFSASHCSCPPSGPPALKTFSYPMLLSTPSAVETRPPVLQCTAMHSSLDGRAFAMSSSESSKHAFSRFQVTHAAPAMVCPDDARSAAGRMSKTRVHLQISDGDANEAIDLEMRDTEVRVVRVLKKDEEGEEIRWRDADDDALTNIYSI